MSVDRSLPARGGFVAPAALHKLYNLSENGSDPFQGW